MTSPKILIVDDEKDILDLLEYNFEKEGFQVLRASDGKIAVDIAQQEQPDLVVMDIMMPIMDGVTACHEMRSYPELEKTAIVFLTARSEEYSEVAGFEAGADDYIHKPIRPKILMSRVRALLRRQDSQINNNNIKVHDLEIVRDEYIVRRGEDFISLPRKEFETVVLHGL